MIWFDSDSHSVMYCILSISRKVWFQWTIIVCHEKSVCSLVYVPVAFHVLRASVCNRSWYTWYSSLGMRGVRHRWSRKCTKNPWLPRARLAGRSKSCFSDFISLDSSPTASIYSATCTLRLYLDQVVSNSETCASIFASAPNEHASPSDSSSQSETWLPKAGWLCEGPDEEFWLPKKVLTTAGVHVGGGIGGINWDLPSFFSKDFVWKCLSSAKTCFAAFVDRLTGLPECFFQKSNAPNCNRCPN